MVFQLSVSYSITGQWAPRGQQMNLIIFSITYLVDVKWHLLQKYQIITGAVLRAQCLGAYTEAGLCWWTMGNLLRHSSRRPCTVPSLRGGFTPGLASNRWYTPMGVLERPSCGEYLLKHGYSLKKLTRAETTVGWEWQEAEKVRVTKEKI